MTEFGHLQYPEINAAELIDLMKALYDCRTDRHLAELIGIEDVIFTRWRSRNTFHKEVVFAVAFNKGVSINTLLFGQSETTLSVELTPIEMQAVTAICKQQGLTEAGMVRFAVRLYQEVCERYANGERIEFSGEGNGDPVFVLPMLRMLKARHAPRKSRRLQPLEPAATASDFSGRLEDARSCPRMSITCLENVDHVKVCDRFSRRLKPVFSLLQSLFAP